MSITSIRALGALTAADAGYPRHRGGRAPVPARPVGDRVALSSHVRAAGAAQPGGPEQPELRLSPEQLRALVAPQNAEARHAGPSLPVQTEDHHGR